MKKKIPRKKQTTRKARKLEEIFSDEWLKGLRERLEDLEKSDLNKPDDTFKKASRMMFVYRCIADLILEYAPQEVLSRVFRDTETVCNRMGISLRDRTEVTNCLAKKHDECRGAYYNPVADRTIICKCKCHSMRSSNQSTSN